MPDEGGMTGSEETLVRDGPVIASPAGARQSSPAGLDRHGAAGLARRRPTQQETASVKAVRRQAFEPCQMFLVEFLHPTKLSQELLGELGGSTQLPQASDEVPLGDNPLLPLLYVAPDHA
jgi:hypothetical protein